VIDENDREYMWMDSYLCPSAHEDLFVNTDFKVEMSHPTSQLNWNKFLDTALPAFNVNFYQSVMMIAGAIACFHYPYAIAIAGKFYQILYMSCGDRPSHNLTIL
jgi:hypothetical protein